MSMSMLRRRFRSVFSIAFNIYAFIHKSLLFKNICLRFSDTANNFPITCDISHMENT